MFTHDHIKPKLLSQSLYNVDPDHYFIVWFIHHAQAVTPATRLRGWCVFRVMELDY